MEQTRPFGVMPDGSPVECIALSDGAYTCEIITYGAALRSLMVPDRTGALRDIVLGFDRLEDYIAHDAHFGGTIGRFANRIADGVFSLNGESYHLPKNDGENHLHGGPEGFDRRLWTVERLTTNAVTLLLCSPDGDMGYPGTMEARVTYTLQDGALSIRYDAVSDRDTLCSLTNHAYFNLNGHDSGDALRQMLCLRATHYTLSDASLIPTGEVASVSCTPMDFTEPVPLGARIYDAFEALTTAGGYDHNYVVDDAVCAEAWSDESGIAMTVTTDRPGVQLYTGNFLGGTPLGKDGAQYPKHGGFCLETQAFPDAPNHPTFPSAVLRAGERFESTTIYRFGTVGKENAT